MISAMGIPSGVIQTKAEFIEALTNGKSDFVSIELSQQTVKLVGNTALVRHVLSAATNDGGKAGHYQTVRPAGMAEAERGMETARPPGRESPAAGSISK